MDLQPLRDASYLFDLWLGARLGHTTFHATSFLLFVLLLLAAWRLFEALAPGWPAFAATVVMARRSIFGWAAASQIANTSSCPGSQSMITGMGTELTFLSIFA